MIASWGDSFGRGSNAGAGLSDGSLWKAGFDTANNVLARRL